MFIKTFYGNSSTTENKFVFVDKCGLFAPCVFNLQSVFDKLEPEEMRRARTRSNPFETIRGGFFLNRAAMKMANMDRVFDFLFTKPKDEDGVSVIIVFRLR